MRTTLFLVSGCTLLTVPLAAQQINPANQINWPKVAGFGSPTALSLACTAVNYGMPYTDLSGNKSYVCSSSGWIGGTGSSGVSSINGVAGAFTFTGSGVSCATTTCTFSGGSGGGVGAGAASEVAVYTGPSSVGGSPYLLDSAAPASGNGMLSYSGKLGAQIVTSFGGGFNVLLNNNGGTPSSSAANQINLTTTLNTVSTPQAGAGNIVLNANDIIGNNGAANINITAATPVADTTSNSGNINLKATGYYGGNSGFINLLADGISIQDQGAGINMTTNSAQNGTAISLVNNAPNGTIQLNATGGFLIFGSTNFSIDGSGDITDPSLAATSAGCLYTDSAGLFHTTNTSCGGSGGSIGGSGTVGTIPIFVTNTTTIGNSPITVASGVVTSADPVAVNDGSGTGGAFIGTQGTAPSGVSGSDLLWADSTAGRFKMNNNNGGAQYVVGLTTAGTSGDCVKLASNGIDSLDSGSPCPTSGTSFTPTLVADGGAGTGGSLFLGLVSGSNDDNGWINLTTGASPTGTNSGIITVTFGGTYSAVRKCLVVPASTLAVQLGTNGTYVPSGTATAAHFVITGGPTALPANTTGYAWFYKCGN